MSLRQVLRYVPVGFLMLGAISPISTFGDLSYSNNFSGSVGSEWSDTKRATAPFGEVFLGDYTNDSITLSLVGLPAHNSLTIGLDLYIINSMDGNCNGNPDLWTMSVVNGPVLLSSTFTNPLNSTSGPDQSYPDNYPASHLPQTGATAVNALGYGTVYNGYISPAFGDSTYHLAYTFANDTDTVQFNFVGAGMGYGFTGQYVGTLDESWGIDNVAVSYNVPEPTVFALMSLGAAGLLIRRRRA